MFTSYSKMDVLTLILITVVTILFFLFVKYRSKQGSPPPGPTGYPIIGNTFDVDSTKLHLSLSEFADTHGDIYKLNIFGRDTIVLNSPELVREALMKEPNASVFAARINSYFGNEFMFKRSDLAFSSNTDTWVKRRKFSHRLLKAYGEGLKVIEKRVHEELSNTVKSVKKYSGEAFDPEELITSFLISIITNLLTGKHYERNSDFSQAILDYDSVINEILNPLFGAVMKFFPFMKYVPGKFKELHNRCRMMQQRFFELVRKEKDHCDDGMIHDLYQKLSQIKENENDGWLTEDVILAILTNMISGGILTSKGAIWSLIRILMSSPDVQKRIQEEVDTVVGSDRLPSLTDKSSMPYTEAVVFETIRLISHLPLSVPHVNSEDAKLGGYDIKKGSMILINIWRIQLNGKVFDKPYEFNPDRFLGEDGHIISADSTIRQSFLSFGLGKRACIGEIFARNRIFLFLACMMQKFTFVPENGEPLKMLDPRDMVQLAIRMPQRYKCRAIERQN